MSATPDLEGSQYQFGSMDDNKNKVAIISNDEELKIKLKISSGQECLFISLENNEDDLILKTYVENKGGYRRHDGEGRNG